MKSLARILLFVLLTAIAGGAAQSPFATRVKPEWVLVWSDEFNAPDGSPPDPARWTLEVGGNGFGNNELEYYTDRPRNTHLDKGNLLITAVAERYTGPDGVTRQYTSARMKTSKKFSRQFGRFEARMKLPQGRGFWPAFWLLGEDCKKWPNCGEIDIMENVGSKLTTVLGTIHGPGYSGDKGISRHYELPLGETVSDGFHVYAVEWEAAAIRFYMDGVLYATTTPADLPAGTRWVFDHPFFIILNLAVGGNLPGSPDAETKFPQSMLVDYVRVYEQRPPPVTAAKLPRTDRKTGLRRNPTHLWSF